MIYHVHSNPTETLYRFAPDVLTTNGVTFPCHSVQTASIPTSSASGPDRRTPTGLLSHIIN